ncbi:MAG: hypothetical protein IIB22_07765 [Chloroflexi bacterium]|nr:hypothetical protein [Chloroflexota bacterium]
MPPPPVLPIGASGRSAIDIARDAAQEAGALALSRFRRPHEITVKGRGDLLTETDLAVEKLLHNAIKAEFPEHALLSEETASTIYELARKLGKEPVYCRDTFGFLANRAARGRNDALELLWAHIATPEDIDKAMRLGYNHPMGPLELGDLIGSWSLSVHAEEDTITEFGWDGGHVHPLVKMMVRAGYTGGQGKKGIYDFWRDVLSKW